MSHSRLSPSAAGRWLACHGSVSMSERFPETGRSEAAEEGTAAHWVGSEVLSGRGADPFVGRTAPNGVIITDEMVEAAKVYVASVARVAATPTHRHIEKKMVVERVHPECFGTPDCWSYTPGELHVWDFKYGFGIVEPMENWQLICYAAGALEQVAPGGVADQHTRVILHIVQPRPFHVLGAERTWSIMASDLRGYVNRLAGAAALALGPNPQCTSGDHCQYCSARHACPAAQQAAMRSVDVTYQAVSQLLSSEALAIELRTLQRASAAIKNRLTGLETQAIAMLQGGALVPGYGIQNGTGRQRWVRPADEVFALGDLLGIDLRAAPEPLTPAQARKAGLDGELLSAYTEIPVTGIKLVPQDRTIAALVFGTQAGE